MIALRSTRRLADLESVPGRGCTVSLTKSRTVRSATPAKNARRETVSALVAQPWGLIEFRAVDPDGYYIRITGRSAGG